MVSTPTPMADLCRCFTDCPKAHTAHTGMPPKSCWRSVHSHKAQASALSQSTGQCTLTKHRPVHSHNAQARVVHSHKAQGWLVHNLKAQASALSQSTGQCTLTMHRPGWCTLTKHRPGWHSCKAQATLIHSHKAQATLIHSHKAQARLVHYHKAQARLMHPQNSDNYQLWGGLSHPRDRRWWKEEVKAAAVTEPSTECPCLYSKQAQQSPNAPDSKTHKGSQQSGCAASAAAGAEIMDLWRSYHFQWTDHGSVHEDSHISYGPIYFYISIWPEREK